MAFELRAGIVPLLSALVGGLVVAIPTYLTSNRQMDVKMVEIAVGILGQKPETNIQPARRWAVDVIEAYSTKVPLSPEVQTALIQNRALANGYGSGSVYVGTSWYGPPEPGEGNPSPEAPLKEPSNPQ